MLEEAAMGVVSNAGRHRDESREPPAQTKEVPFTTPRDRGSMT